MATNVSIVKYVALACFIAKHVTGSVFYNADSEWNVVLESDITPLLKGRLGNHKTKQELSHGLYEEHDSGFSLTWKDQDSVTINQRYDAYYDVTCQDVSWLANDCRERVFEDCYSMTEAHWYGGAPIWQHEWPVDKWSRDMQPFVTGDTFDDEYGGVQARYWFNTNGVSLAVDWEVPLWVSINSSSNQQICFRSTYDNSPYNNIDQSNLFLNYSICQGSDIKEIHAHGTDNYLGKPTDIPDELLFRYPIYSTWARFHKDINQSLVLDFAKEINYYNYSNSQMEIDDHWEITYGRLKFDPEKFPDPKGMVDELSLLGFRTTLWIHPFVDLASDYVWNGGLRFVFLKDPGGILPALHMWWNGVATTVDVTNNRSVDWWTEHLFDLQNNYGIDSFKFDAGEASWLPAAYLPKAPFRNPSDFATRLAEIAYNVDPDVRHQEVRIGAQTQHLPIFVRLLDKSSNWGYDNGLKTVIPHTLLFSTIGYLFPLPDMIGGNAYDSFPDRELFIRWTQVNVFLPGFQFSIVPWDYDDEVITICKDMLDLHEQYADFMIELGRNATITGEPIIRPLWWIAPNDEVAQTIDSEFLVGDILLSAPILEPGAVSRDVYLPQGSWRDMNDPVSIIDGPFWYRDYPAPLDTLPYFVKV